MNDRIMFEELAALILVKYKSLNNFAKAMGFSRQTLCKLLYGKQPWTLPKMEKANALLNVQSGEEIKRLYFGKTLTA